MREASGRGAALLAVVLLVASAPAAQAQAEEFGSQVRFPHNDFVPTYETVTPLDASYRYLYVEAGEVGVGGDRLYLNVDGDPVGNGVEVNDVRLTPHLNRTAGTLVAANDTTERSAAVAPSVAVVGAFYADRDGNGRYTAGDRVYLTGSADVRDGIGATTGSTHWTLRLTPTTGAAAGTFVLPGDPDLSETRILPFQVDGELDGGTPEAPELSWGLFNADRDRGDALEMMSPGDRLYLEVDATPAPTASASATAPGGRVSLHSIRLGEDGFGTQVRFGDPDFVPTLLATPYEVVRYEGADATNFTDDTIALKVRPDRGPGLQAGDMVLTTGAGRNATDLLGPDDPDLGQGTAAISGIEVGLVYADVDKNGHYTRGDYVYLVGDDAGYAWRTDLDATELGEENHFALRLTDTSGGTAGTFVAEGDQDLTDHGAADAVAAMDRASFAFFDADRDGLYGDGDRAYLSGGGGLLDLYALRLHTDLGGYGSQVVFGDVDYVPQVIVHGTIAIIRYHGTETAVGDDVIVLDADGDGGAIEANDLVLSGPARGTHVAAGSGLIGKGNDDSTVSLVYVDRNGDGRYGAGDWVYLRESMAAGSIVASDTSRFTLRLTDTVGGEAGTFVKAGDPNKPPFPEDEEDLKHWNNRSLALNSISDVGILDADRNGVVSPGDRVYLTEGIRLVDLHALRLVGASENRTVLLPPDAAGPDPAPGGPDPADPAPGGSPGSGGAPGSGVPPADTEDEESPGPGLVLGAAALGVALVLVRRRA